jgi:hypothetical protein
VVVEDLDSGFRALRNLNHQRVIEVGTDLFRVDMQVDEVMRRVHSGQKAAFPTATHLDDEVVYPVSVHPENRAQQQICLRVDSLTSHRLQTLSSTPF